MKIALLAQGKIAKECFRELIPLVTIGKLEVSVISCDDELWSDVVDSAIDVKHRIEIDKRADDELRSKIEDSEVQVIISIQYPWILSDRVLFSVRGRAFNLHNARLPNYRGHNSLSHEILNDDKHHVTTIHWMQPKVDSGYVVCEKEIEILASDTAYSLYNRTKSACVNNFVTFISMLINSLELPKQPIKDGGTFYSKIEIEHLKEIQELSKTEIDRKSRAFYFPPYEPAYILIDGRKYYVTPGNLVD